MDILEKINKYLNESSEKKPIEECILTSVESILSGSDDENSKLEKIAKLIADNPIAEASLSNRVAKADDYESWEKAKEDAFKKEWDAAVKELRDWLKKNIDEPKKAKEADALLAKWGKRKK